MVNKKLEADLEEIIFSTNVRAEILNKLMSYIDLNYTYTPVGTARANDWIKEWVDLFPIGVSSGGKLIRSDKIACLNKMNRLLKDNPSLTKDLIFSVTLQYLEERRQENYAYTKCATYFIDKKGEGSELLARCESNKTIVKNSSKIKEEVFFV